MGSTGVLKLGLFNEEDGCPLILWVLKQVSKRVAFKKTNAQTLWKSKQKQRGYAMHKRTPSSFIPMLSPFRSYWIMQSHCCFTTASAVCNTRREIAIKKCPLEERTQHKKPPTGISILFLVWDKIRRKKLTPSQGRLNPYSMVHASIICFTIWYFCSQGACGTALVRHEAFGLPSHTC